MKKIAILYAAMAICAGSAHAATPLWLRDVKISPNGEEIAFCYQGDIYKVSSKGGTAVRLTTTPSYESTPIWSPDGSKIAFASDRAGSLDIYIMSANGGNATRLTYNSSKETPEAFSTDGHYVMFSAAIQDPAESAMFPGARLTEYYRIPVEGGRIEQVLATPVQMPSYDKGGKFFIYQDYKGTENEWRKHHTSSVTRDIWKYDTTTGKHTNLTSHAGEDRNPVLSADGKSMLFLSERSGGSMNVYEMPLNTPGATPKALTTFKEHPVRFLSQGSNGLVALTYDGEIYTMTQGSKPTKLNIDLVVDGYNPTEYIPVTSGASGSVPSPDGTMIAFVKRGEVFVTSVEYATTKQITNTAAAERGISWGSDNRTLYYTSERDGKSNIYSATMTDKTDPNFANATMIEEKALFSTTDKTERENPDVSPDGKSLAFIADRSKLMVMDIATKKVRQITDGTQNASRSGFDFAWSPDSKWIAFTMTDNRHDPYYNIGLVNVEGTPEITNVTNTGYFDMNPVWSPDGNALLFATDRYGMRSHASWGSQEDVMAVFLNQEAYDRYRLNEEDLKLLKDAEKKSEADSKKDSNGSKKDSDKDKDKDSKDSKDKKDSKADSKKTIVVEREGLEDRTVRLTPYSGNISGAAVDGDFEKLYYLCKVEKGYDLWKIDLRKGDISVTSKLASKGGASLVADSKGKNIFILGSDVMKKMELPGEKIKAITYSAKMKLDREAEREAMFAQVRNREAEKFYVADMHGVNWDALTKHYSKFLPHINNNYDFSVMLSELLGELNVSHTGSGYRAPAAPETTGNLGVLYDLTYTGKGLKIAEVVKGSPLSHSKTKVTAGCIVEKINSQEIGDKSDYTPLFNGTVGEKTLVSIYNPSTGEHFNEVVRPISQSKMNDLLYERWVEQRAADVDRLSNGRLGYVHIKSMDDASFRRIYADILGKYNTREGIVIDTRYNGGGRLHEDIEILFSGEKYFTQEVRGKQLCDMPSRRWNKPSILIQGEANYSNAHGTPWVYKHRNLGKLVGMPVPGTMTSVNWVTLQDPSLYFGIPVIGYRLPDGSFLENQQLEPDVKIANDADVVVTGTDQQLQRAVSELLSQLDKK